MKPDSSPNPRQKLEARVTALLLGEITGAEADNLRKAIAQDPELTKICERLKSTIELVRETTTSPAEPVSEPAAPLKLSEERRRKLLAHFKTIRLKEAAPKRRRFRMTLIEVAVVVAVTAILAAMLLPSLSASKEKARSFAVRSRLQQLDTAKQQWALENNKSATDEPTFDDLKAYLGRGVGNFPPPVAGETYRLGKVGDPVTADFDTADARRLFGRKVDTQTIRGGPVQQVRLSVGGDLAYVDENGRTTPITRVRGPQPDSAPALSPPAVVNVSGRRAKGEAEDSRHFTSMPTPPPATPRTPVVLPAEESLSEENSLIEFGSESKAQPPRPGTTYTIGAAGDSAAPGWLWNQRGAGTHHYRLTTNSSRSVEPGGDAQSWNLASAEVPPPVAGETLSIAGTDSERLGASLGDFSAGGHADSFGVHYSTDGGEADLAAGSGKITLSGFTEHAGRTTAMFANSDGQFARDDSGGLAGKVPVLGDVPVAGQLFRSESAQGVSAAENRGEALIAPEVLATNGITTVTLDHADAQAVPVAQASQEGSSLTKSWSISATLRGFSDDNVTTANANKQSSGGTEVRSAVTTAPVSAKPAAPARSYDEAKLRLEELKQARAVLRMKMAEQGTDLYLPKTSMVQIFDRAVAGPDEKRSLREKLTGNVERFARLKVDRDVTDIDPVSGTRYAPGYDPYFIQTEFEVIQSEVVLGKVVEKLNLNETWAKKYGHGGKLNTAETVDLLKKQLDLRQVRGTTLIEIGVKSDSSAEAANIANAIAEAYQAHRLEQNKEWTLAGVKALEERYADKEKEIALAQAEVDRLQKDTAPEPDLPAAKPGIPLPVPQPEIQTRNNAFSTFSLNVSDVSFKLAAASLQKGVLPEPGSIRSEEFINAFDYRDPEPAPGAPIAFAWERARYPFAHNRDLLRFSLKTAAQGRQAGRPLNLVLLLDNSGSMERADRVSIIREALRVLASQLQPQDLLSVVTFARTPRLWVDGAPGFEAARIAEEISELTPQGGTNLEDAMNLAYETALRHYLAGGINRVVVLTDGAANLGNVNPDALKQKVEAHRKQGIALDCFGIGWEGYNDDLLEVLSRNGDGRYGFINTPEEAASGFAGQLAGALQVAASDVKVQVEFNPARVTAYRQIGYAKHQLTKEQFRDNTVDAAEIGAAESGNALYVIEVNAGGQGPLGVVRVRYKVPGTNDYREQEWVVPYTSNVVSLEQASPAMRLAASGSAFSEWLATSPYASEVTPDRLLRYLRGVPEVYGAADRPKTLEWMIRQAGSIAGK